MRLTSKDASKLLKQYEEELSSIKKNEDSSKTWVASTTENKEDVRPDYDYATTQENIRELNAKIRKLRHAINLFNVSTVIPEFNITIDEMLVYIPQLNAQKLKLAKMKDQPKFVRCNDMFRAKGNFIDYEYINYDLLAASNDYAKVSEELSKAQLALDKVNIRETLEVNI